MSMIPADLSVTPSAAASGFGAVRRLPRAVGWLSAAVVSAGLWSLTVEAIRLIV